MQSDRMLSLGFLCHCRLDPLQLKKISPTFEINHKTFLLCDKSVQPHGASSWEEVPQASGSPDHVLDSYFYLSYALDSFTSDHNCTEQGTQKAATSNHPIKKHTTNAQSSLLNSHLCPQTTPQPSQPALFLKPETTSVVTAQSRVCVSASAASHVVPSPRSPWKAAFCSPDFPLPTAMCFSRGGGR